MSETQTQTQNSTQNLSIDEFFEIVVGYTFRTIEDKPLNQGKRTDIRNNEYYFITYEFKDIKLSITIYIYPPRMNRIKDIYYSIEKYKELVAKTKQFIQYIKKLRERDYLWIMLTIEPYRITLDTENISYKLYSKILNKTLKLFHKVIIEGSVRDW